MNVGVFHTVRGGAARFQRYAEKYKDTLNLMGFACPPVRENLKKLKENNCEAMIYMADHQESEDYYKEIAEQGVRYICCCSAGYEHLNRNAMKKYGLKGANVPVYSPNAIAEHTVMILLALLRKFRSQILRIEQNDYNIKGLMGREIRNMKIGIVGAGRIGYTTLQCLSGFRPKKLYVNDPYENEKVKEYAEYVPLKTLYKESDILLFHCIANEENYHMVNEKTMADMKEGVILINVARGVLFDIEAVLEGLEKGKIGALGLDVIEDEGALKAYEYTDHCPLPVLEKLLKLDNVIFTRHTAFYTDEAVRNLTAVTIENLYSYATTGTCQNELIR